MVYRRQRRPHWFVSVPTSHGWCKRSTGTSHKPTARAMERMLAELGATGRREWDFLDRVADGSLELAVLYDAWSRDDLGGLRHRIDDVDLTLHIAGWQAWLRDRVGPTSRDRYLAHIATLMPDGKPFYRSGFTGPAVAQWLATRVTLVRKRRPAATGSRRREDPAPVPASGPTKRRYLAAVRSFARYLVEVGVLEANPLRDIQAPRPNAPRCSFLELPDVLRLVEGATGPYPAIFALAYGAGLEISAILSLVETDVDLREHQVRARGTKAWTRDRMALVADWAWLHVERHLRAVLPGERVFRGVHRWAAGDMHRERCRALGLTGYRLHDARHHWAVRMIRAGMPLELVARQLGHRDVVMVARVYGRFVPTTVERHRWERAASTLDREKWPTLGTLGGTAIAGPAAEAARGPSVTPAIPPDYRSSRGGTRTRDPGIMSAVL